jgi:hypothetical protein
MMNRSEPKAGRSVAKGPMRTRPRMRIASDNLAGSERTHLTHCHRPFRHIDRSGRTVIFATRAGIAMPADSYFKPKDLRTPPAKCASGSVPKTSLKEQDSFHCISIHRGRQNRSARGSQARGANASQNHLKSLADDR